MIEQCDQRQGLFVQKGDRVFCMACVRDVRRNTPPVPAHGVGRASPRPIRQTPRPSHRTRRQTPLPGQNPGARPASKRTKQASGGINVLRIAGAGFSVRHDRTNPHSGGRALVVRNTRDGLEPGMLTSMSLPAAKYRLRFWASCEFDKKARVMASLAGTEMPAVIIGEDYARYEHVVTLPEKKIGASMRLWTTSPNVRVYFDDVEVEAVVDK
jgi:hypothetical protein